jgi:hypothetical protein
MSGGGGFRPGKTPHKSSSFSSSSLVTPMTKHPYGKGGDDDGNETPIACNNDNNNSNQCHHQQAPNHHERRLYTPAHFTLAKNAELHMDSIRPDAFSPATIRMTDSLERILTDDDDFMEAKQRLLRAQEHSLMRRKVTNGREGTTTKTTAMAVARRPPDDDVNDVPVGDRGTFRRIQSTASDSADEEMDEVMDSHASGDGVVGRPDETSHEDDKEEEEEEEEELEISQINDNEDADVDDDDDDDDDGETKTDISIGRPKPLNFDRPSGPPKLDGGSSSVVSASGGGAFKPPGRVAVPTTTPRPRRTMPRHHAGGGSAYQGIEAHQHLSQQHGRGVMYYPQQQQGYFGQQQGVGERAEGIMAHGYPQHPASNALFNEHPSHSHLQYCQPQSHHPYAPSHHNQHHNHPSQSFHLPPMPSPQNVGFGPILPTGLVSPLNLPPDYSHGHGTIEYHPHSHGNTSYADARDPYPNHGGLGDDHWWRLGPSGHDGYSHSVVAPPQQSHGMHHLLDNSQHHGGMGMIPISGHPSPDYSYHELSGAVSPFNLLPFSSFPSPTQSNQYPRHNHHHHVMAPLIYHPSVTPVAVRPRTKSKENNGPRVNNIRRLSPSPYQMSTLTKQPGPHGQSRVCRRKDSATSIDSALRGEDDLGGLSSSSALRQSFSGLNTSVSVGEGYEQNDWFYLSDHTNAPPTHSKSYLTEATEPGMMESKLEQSLTGAVMPMQNIHGLGGHNRRRGLSVSETKVKQQRWKESVTRGHQSSPHLDVLRTNVGLYQESGVGGAKNEDVDQSRGDFVLESPSERQAFKEFCKQFRQKENESLSAATKFGLTCLSESNRDLFLPPVTHWRVYLELADVAKRSNQTNVARSHYRHACALQPRASQGWLEHSKLEEENGNLRKCATILQEGLKQCETNENLLIRAVKFYERMGDLDQARQLLSRLKYMSIDKSWKMILEGGLLEARAGRYSMVRKYLCELIFCVLFVSHACLLKTSLFVMLYRQGRY